MFALIFEYGFEKQNTTLTTHDRKAEERQARRNLIINGALSVFKEQGIDGATMEHIANTAGFGTASPRDAPPERRGPSSSACQLDGQRQ